MVSPTGNRDSSIRSSQETTPADASIRGKGKTKRSTLTKLTKSLFGSFDKLSESFSETKASLRKSFRTSVSFDSLKNPEATEKTNKKRVLLSSSNKAEKTDETEAKEPKIKIPIPLQVAGKLIDQLRSKNAKAVDGIFRVSGNAQAIKDLRAGLAKDREMNIETIEDLDSYAMGVALKQTFKEIAPFGQDSETEKLFQDAGRVNNEKDAIPLLKKAVSQLPEENKKSLSDLLNLLKEVEENSETNRMDAHNLGVVWGPNMIKDNKNLSPLEAMNRGTTLSHAFEYLLKNKEEIFS